MPDKDHLDHLPGRTYLGTVALVALLAAAVGTVQLTTAHDGTSAAMWGIVLSLGVVSLIALAVAWEERRAHIHALVREILETDADARTAQQHALAMAELMRLGAHREIEFVNRHVVPPRGT